MDNKKMRSAVVIPTLNAGADFENLLKYLQIQELALEMILVADSGSTDQTLFLAKQYQCEIISVEQGTFNHGSTRQFCVEYLRGKSEIVVFLTQDVRFSFENKMALQRLVDMCLLKDVAVAYGRQLPHIAASPLAKQARLFNYPAKSRIKSLEDKQLLGIKTAFLSDSFAAYRIDRLLSIGGFPHVIVSEDMYVGAKFLQAGWKIAYCAEAETFHSHTYTLQEEFRRYFDIGVFQARESWIRQYFGQAEGEGIKMVVDQMHYLWETNEKCSIIKAIFTNAIRILAYKTGLQEKYLPEKVKCICSGQSYFFQKN